MGISTYLRNGTVNGWVNNQPLVVPTFCASLHDGNPTDEGTNAATTLIDTEEDRSQITATDAASGTATGTGDPAKWTVEEHTTLTNIGYHDAIAAGNFLGQSPVDQPVEVFDGDIVHLALFSVTQKASA